MEKLGEGGFGSVFKVRSKYNQQLFALKSVPSANVKDPAAFERELDIAKMLDHPYIIRLYETFNDDKGYHLIMDLCTGGDLHEHIGNSIIKERGHIRGGGLSTSEVGRITWMILNAVAYLHNYRFAHRDIKPENFLVPTSGRRSLKSGLKLIDFGLGRSFQKGKKMYSRVGTVPYVAPEVMESGDGYDEKCDMWSVGVMVYVLSVARLPFLADNDKDILALMKKGGPTFTCTDWHRHPSEVKSLIKELVNRDVAVRPSAKNLLMMNEWTKKYAVKEGEEVENLSGNPCCVLQ